MCSQVRGQKTLRWDRSIMGRPLAPRPTFLPSRAPSPGREAASPLGTSGGEGEGCPGQADVISLSPWADCSTPPSFSIFKLLSILGCFFFFPLLPQKNQIRFLQAKLSLSPGAGTWGTHASNRQEISELSNKQISRPAGVSEDRRGGQRPLVPPPQPSFLRPGRSGGSRGRQGLHTPTCT